MYKITSFYPYILSNYYMIGEYVDEYYFYTPIW